MNIGGGMFTPMLEALSSLHSLPTMTDQQTSDFDAIISFSGFSRVNDGTNDSRETTPLQRHHHHGNRNRSRDATFIENVRDIFHHFNGPR